MTCKKCSRVTFELILTNEYTWTCVSGVDRRLNFFLAPFFPFLIFVLPNPAQLQPNTARNGSTRSGTNQKGPGER